MVIKINTEQTLADIASTRNRTMLISILGTFTIIALTYSMLNRLVRRPVEGLAKTAKRFAEGDMSVSVDVKTEDEIGVLGNTFNYMMGKISSFSKGLELKVEERTAMLNEKTHLLEQANKELEVFAYSVSHDLRAPLRGIDGFSKMLMEEYSVQINERGKHYMNRIRDGTNKMSVLIDDMLTFSRAGRKELQLMRVECRRLIDDSLDDFIKEIQARGISVKIGKLLVIRCDPTLMQTVFSNLISNAIKFTREKEKPEIIIGFDDEKGAIFVKDNDIV
ncbi:MAG: histidine kinase dimerization/phospho-acceptor domain-containing protein [Nitrospirota bacterium]